MTLKSNGLVSPFLSDIFVYHADLDRLKLGVGTFEFGEMSPRIAHQTHSYNLSTMNDSADTSFPFLGMLQCV
jgi:hypothetical protein